MKNRVAAWARPLVGIAVSLVTVAGAQAQPTTLLFIDSQAGDWVGRGQRFALTPADGTFTASRTFDQGVSVSFSGPSTSWNLHFAAPGPAPLVPGLYEGATRWPFQSPTDPGLDVTGYGGGCGQVAGRFAVLEAVYDVSGNVQRFAADFEQHCDGATPALFGSVRYGSAVPLGPRLSVSGTSTYEGDVGTSPVAVVVSLSAPVAAPVSVQYRAQDGTATANADYVPASGGLVIPAGQTAVTVPLGVIGDAEIEGDETFLVVLENAQGAPLAFATGVQTIFDDDPYKTLLAFDSQPGDPIGGGRKFTLTPVDGSITTTRNFSNGIRIDFDGSTFWYLNFAAPNQAPITPGLYEGATRWPFQSPTGPGLDVSGDGLGCSQLTGRFVVLEAVYDGIGGVERFAADYEQHCEGGEAALFGSVRFRSAVPLGSRLSVGVPPVYEGDLGTAAVFAVISLSAPAAQPVSVHYRTQDATATAGADYVATSGAVVIPPGETTTTVALGVIGDTAVEGDETLAFVLEDPQGAPIAFATSIATILDDDPYKTVLIFDSQPGDYIGQGRRFTLTPVDGSIAATGGGNAVTVTFQGADQWGLNFAAPSGALLAPGVYEHAQRSASATWPGLDVYGAGRGCNQLTGRFTVLEAVHDAGAVQRFAVDYEQHCEGGPSALFGWVRFNSSVALPLQAFPEGGSAPEAGGSGIAFRVRLSGTSPAPVTIDYATIDGSAIGDLDYVRSMGTLVIPAGAPEGLVTVPLIDDAAYEGTETFELQLTRATGALIGRDAATGTILDDDEAPVVSLGDVTVREGDPGRPGIARVPVTLDKPAGQHVTLSYRVVPRTALAGQDFVVPAGPAIIGPAQTTATIDVPLVADMDHEGVEQFGVELVTASGAQIGIPGGTVTVEDDDGATDFYTLEPCRLLDTRLTSPPIRSNRSVTFGVGGICGVPPTAKAVVLNVTAVSPSASGHFRISPTGTPVPPTSILNFVAGQTRAVGPVFVTLGLNDAATLHCVLSTAGAAHATVDVSGYFE